jgi:Sigma-70 region 2
MLGRISTEAGLCESIPETPGSWASGKQTPLRRYITCLAGADLADDILQETSIQIFRKLQFLREPAVFHAWALGIASRIAISHLKRAHRWQPLDDSPLGTFTPNPDPWRATRCSLLLSSRPTSRPPVEWSSFFTTSTTFRSRKPQPFSTFLSAPPSHVSIMESRHFANTSLSKGSQYESRIPTAQLQKYERRNHLRPTGPRSRRQVGTPPSNQSSSCLAFSPPSPSSGCTSTCSR